MLNEYVYCPRLFHIEWAEARWAENDDTTAGSLSHTWVDHRGGRMPDPDDDQPPVMTTAVRISNDELGLTAIIDRVDHADGTCTPVDYRWAVRPLAAVLGQPIVSRSSLKLHFYTWQGTALPEPTCIIGQLTNG